MDVKTIELKKLKPYEKNTRLHTEEQIGEFAEFAEFGILIERLQRAGD